ncbi:MAG: HD domain-containing protein [Nitrospirae bacterium]|nr:HD domain-containing protein [Nitrospirota bacterium]
MKIGQKLILGYVGISILVGVIGFVLLIQLNKISKPIHKDIPESLKKVGEASYLNQLAELIRYYDEVLTQSARNYAFTKNKKWEKRYKGAEPELNKIIKESIRLGDTKDKEFFSSIDKANTALVEMEYNSIELVNKGMREEAVRVLESDTYWNQKFIYEQGLRKYSERKGLKYKEAFAVSTEIAEAATKKARDLIENSIRVTIIFVIGSSILAMGIGILITRFISRPLNLFRKATEKIEAGDLDCRVELKTGDEIEALAKSFNKMVESLKKDIIERNKTEKLLLKSKQDWEDSFNTITDMTIIQDKDFNIMRANKAAQQILGLPYLEINKVIKCHDNPHGKDYQRNYETLKKGVPAIFEFFEPNLNIYFEIRAIPRFDSNNQLIGLIHIIRDITERKHYEELTQLQLKRLNTLHSVEKAITTSLDLHVTLDILLDQVTTQLGIDAAAMLLFNQHTQMLEYIVSKGFRSSALRYTQLKLGESNAGLAAVERRIVTIPNLTEEPDGFVRSKLFNNEDFITYFAAPLIAKGQIKGVLELFHRAPLEANPEWLEFLETVADQAAVAIDNATLFEGLQRSNIDLTLAYDTTIEGWSRAMDLRDKETEGHTRRVTEMTLRIAHELGIKEEEIVHIRRGALLHDMGKMGIPDSILLKPGPLTDEEWIIMKRHPVYAYEMLHQIEYLRPALDIPYCHHEKWDGSGYPRGLKAEEIPLAARIFAVVDVWDALRSDRPYRPAWPKEKVREHIRSLSGTHFDSNVVEVFLKMEW